MHIAIKGGGPGAIPSFMQATHIVFPGHVWLAVALVGGGGGGQFVSRNTGWRLSMKLRLLCLQLAL